MPGRVQAAGGVKVQGAKVVLPQAQVGLDLALAGRGSSKVRLPPTPTLETEPSRADMLFGVKCTQ